MFSSSDFYKHVLLTLTLFILLENVGKIGQDLSVGPDSRGGGPSAESIFGLCPFHFNTINTDIPVWATACHLLLFCFSLLVFFKSKQKIVLSDESLLLSISREERSRMDTVPSTN